MVFSSITFIFVFLPAFFLIYYLAPVGLKNLVIFIGSLIFYFYGVRNKPEYFLLILLSIFINYICGGRIAANKEPKKRKRWLVIGRRCEFFSVNSDLL